VIGIGVNIGVNIDCQTPWTDLHSISTQKSINQFDLTKDLINKILEFCQVFEANGFTTFSKQWASVDYLQGKRGIEKLSDVKASIEAKVVNIIGRVVGNINANEKIIIHEGGSVTGDMDAPKVILKDGSYFKGSVSMAENKKIEPTTTKEESKTQTNKLV
jgi:biotin-(acetyl-CoA carboxylase) ligase